MGIPVRKTLLVGLGGTGQLSLVEIKNRMERAYGGKVPPVIKFVSLDAAPPDDRTKDVLDDNEFQALSVDNVQGYIDIKREELDEWLDYQHIQWTNFKRIGNGAGQIRQVGRLALHVNRRHVLDLLRAQLQSLSEYTATQSTQWDVSDEPIQVIIFGSVAGGTGAGTILDLACALKDDSLVVSAYLILPGAFRGKPFTKMVEENAYAFLMELDFMLSQGERIKRGEYGSVFDVVDGTDAYHMANPFDKVMLVDNENAAGTSYPEPKDLAEAVALGILAETGSTMGSEGSQRTLNGNNFSFPAQGGKQCWYSTFGIADLHYPSTEYAEFGTALFIQQLVLQMSQGEAAEADAPDDSTDFEAFLNDSRLQELTKQNNQIIDSILEPKQFVANIPASGVGKESQIEDVWAQNEMLLQKYVEQVTKDAALGRERRVAELRDGVHDKVNHLVLTRSGGAAKSFVDRLRGHFTAVQPEMVSECAEAQNQAAVRLASARALKSECLTKVKVVFGKERATAAILATYRVKLAELGRTYAEQARTHEADILCTSLISTLDDIERTLGAQQAAVSALVTASTQLHYAAKEALTKAKPFEILVTPPLDDVKIPTASARHFYGWLEEADKRGPLDFWALSAPEAMEALSKYAYEQDVSKDLRGGSLADAFAQMTPAQREVYIGLADKKASPLLRLDKGMISALPSPSEPEAQYLVGAPVAFKEVFDAKRDGATGAQEQDGRSLRDRLMKLGVKDVHHVNLEDKDHAYFYRLFGCVPAYVMANFDLLRGEYMSYTTTPGSWSLHLDKRWDAILPDLDFGSGSNEKLYVWALVSSDIPFLQLVKRAGTHYTFLAERKVEGKNYTEEQRLGNGLGAARAAFFEKKEFVAQAEDYVQAALKAEGNSRVAEEVEAYMDRMELEQKSAEPSRQELLKQEIAVLGTWVKSIR